MLLITKPHPLTIVLLLISSFIYAEDYSLVSGSAVKRVWIPRADMDSGWRTDIGFDDSDWLLCEGEPGGVGYEYSSGYDTLITLDVENRMHESGEDPNAGCYVRLRFHVEEAEIAQMEYLALKMFYDDGFIAYLNGVKIAEANAPANPEWNSPASSDHEAYSQAVFDVSAHISGLVAGENLLAIQGFNVSTSSSDFLILPELAGSDSQFGAFTSTNLPLVFINTGGQSIPDEPKIPATMKIISNPDGLPNSPVDPPTYYDGPIGIEIRGSYSSTFPQTPYGIETRDAQGENNNVSLLGMPAENDWALITNYNEKSLVRTTLAFDLFRAMGHYAPRASLCEVMVNSVYQGIYVFTEKIKRDDNRVNIATLNPDEISGDDLTGGYIIKIDYYDQYNSWQSKYHPIGYPYKDVYFVHYYPKPDEIAQEQRNYIRGFFDKLEAALYGANFDDPGAGYRSYIDLPSFIDYFILSEVSRNVDGYKKSRYWYKDKDSNGGLLKAGPVWDFDWAWKNIRECFFANTDGSGWAYLTNDCDNWPVTPGWYVRLLQDASFTERLIERYSELRNSILDLDRINAYIDSIRMKVDEAQERHFELWPIADGYMAPEVEAPSQSYDQEIDKLKDWIGVRMTWLDEHIPLLINEAGGDEEPPVSCKVYPNPSSGQFTIESDKTFNQIQIYNSTGQLVYHSSMSIGHSHSIQILGQASGVYFVRVLLFDQEIDVAMLVICSD